MPPKRKITSTTKHNDASDTESVSQSQPPAKRAKPTETPTDQAKAPNGQPTNKVLPVHITFPPRAAGTLRFAAWNVCGLAAAQRKGFKYYVEAEDPDILVLTETKVNNEPVDPILSARFPYRTWAISGKKTYSGTAVLSKVKPISVTKLLPGHPDPDQIKGRLITLEFEGCYVVCTYVTNAGQNLKTLKEKNMWNEHFTTFIRDLDKKKPVIWMGDMNVAPTATDLANPSTNWNKTPGYTLDETEAFRNILDAPESPEGTPKFIDIWRARHPDDRHYTYFSYRFNCRMKGIGWRLDMFVLSERMVDKVKMCEIRNEIYGASDHLPVVMEIESGQVTGTETPAGSLDSV
ncbi:Endonuclease/exonuclease/phosphatase [Boletus edulis BED1]|uniref:Endonuclease/exonuclease/phosphatase n=1 Tax=Boletus edulis BED1 TaxID=1328754 RepID=A0AAD4C3R0_BOLED|nr:Endonuclease/exonuclease/phosphatase [Boletus edulis BED1]